MQGVHIPCFLFDQPPFSWYFSTIMKALFKAPIDLKRHTSLIYAEGVFGLGARRKRPMLRTMEQAEQARINRRAAESVAAFDEATLLWPNGVLFHRDDDDDDDANGPLAHPFLIQCQPQRYQGEVRIIGPAGGTVKFGPHDLRIPAGALDHWVVITGEIEVSWHVVADLSPQGLTFAAPAILELTFEKCLGAVTGTEVIGMLPDTLVPEATRDRLRILKYDSCRTLSRRVLEHSRMREGHNQNLVREPPQDFDER